MRGERIEAWARAHEPAVDAVGAAALLIAAVVFGVVVHAEGPYFVFSVLLLGPLSVRRRWPAWCLIAIAVVALAQWLTIRGTAGAVPADVAVPLAVHAAAAYGPRWSSRAGLVAGLAGAVLSGVAWPQLRDTVVAHVVIGGFLGSTVVAAWAVGTMQRLRRSQVDAQRELAVLAERTRIAREMHDVVAHSLAVVIAQADGGRYAARSPAADGAAVAALETIGEFARQALDDTRRILGVLRENSGQPVEPAVGVGEIGELVERVRGSGVEVSLVMEVGTVEPGVGLAAYRIVQEGLTNVMKHAGVGARAEVRVRVVSGELEIVVADDGGGPGEGSGLGIIGMRERVAAYGGSVELRERSGGGSLLRARVPV
ncbi:sensor histidine kinase [Kribbella sp. NPDC051587]|uniref:sensor histidine kinase n=1 Tax=Kribbella sp. NPDC051587 TaxID=3364119 RepID=UPI00379EC5FC